MWDENQEQIQLSQLSNTGMQCLYDEHIWQWLFLIQCSVAKFVLKGHFFLSLTLAISFSKTYCKLCCFWTENIKELTSCACSYLSVANIALLHYPLKCINQGVQGLKDFGRLQKKLASQSPSFETGCLTVIPLICYSNLSKFEYIEAMFCSNIYVGLSYSSIFMSFGLQNSL